MTHFSPGFITNPTTGYTIENAVWFSSTSDTLTKTFSGAGHTQKAVISFWIKQCSAGANNKVFSDSGSDALNFLFNTDDEVRIRWTNAIATAFLSDGQFRDYTAWQHFALAIDMTQATDTNRLKLYVNGVEATVNSTSYPAQSATFTWNTAIEHVIHGAGEAEFYLAEFISLDGQSIVGGDLAITDLVDTDSNGVAVPVDPSELTFGTNGFWLNFADSTNVGLDVSGNTNNFASIGAAEGTTINMTEASDTVYGLVNTANVRVGTSFTLASATSISRIQVYCGRLSGDTGNCYCEIYNATGTVGTDAKGTGTALAISEAQDVSTWSTASGLSGYTWTYFDFATPVTLAAGDYVFVFDSDTSNDLYFRAENYGSQTSNLTNRDASSVWTGSNTYFQNFVMKGHSVIPAAQQVTDSPTDDAENNIGNFSLINANTPTAITLSEGNQRCAGTDQKLVGNIAVTRGSGVKLVVEFEIVNVANWTHLGMIGLGNGSLAEQYWDNDGTWRLNYNSAGNFQFGGTDSSSPASYTTGDFIRMEADFDGDSLEFFKNNVSQGTITIPTTYDQWVWGSWLQGSSPTGDIRINTGQRAFENTPTSGFVGWGTANLPAPSVTDSSDGVVDVTDTEANIVATLAAARTGSDYIEIFKNMDATESWVVRFSDDTGNYMSFDGTAAKATFPTLAGSNEWAGVSIRVGATYGVYTTTVGHTNGADTDQAHSLGSNAKMGVVKRESTGGGSWYFTHPGHQSGYNQLLDTQAAEQNTTVYAAVDATNITVKSAAPTGTYRVIVFEEIEGYLDLPIYDGNGSPDGPFVWTGMSMRWACIRGIDSGSSFSTSVFFDSRYPNNKASSPGSRLDTDGVETTGTDMDFTAGGIKIRSTNGAVNRSVKTYIGWEFAKSPFGGSGVAQARAR